MSASSATSVSPAANGSGYGASPSQLPPPKQMRFVNIEGPPPMKRRRIDAAYEQGPMKKDRHSSDAGIRRENGDEEDKEEPTSAE
ncbi:hypothetical protein PZA11_000144 [Diplocarpon coronariae]